MNDQSQMMNQLQMMNQNQMSSMSQPPQMVNQHAHLGMNHHKSRMLNTSQTHQLMNQSQMVMNQSQAQAMNHSQVMINKSQPQMLNRSYGMWPPPPMDQMKFWNPMKPPGGFVASKQLRPVGRTNWKGKKGNIKRKDVRRKEKSVLPDGSIIGVGGSAIGGGGGYKPPTLKELQHQNRVKARRYFPKKFNSNNRSAPFAPRNTSSFIIRAKKSGGIASLISPCPVTPAVLPTPIFSPSREVLVDMAKEEWGVDGYGSMNGLIRLRSPGNEADAHEYEEEEEGASSESDVEEHVEVERRLDHDLSRFEMIYPNCGADYNNVLENRVDDQDTHIAQLGEENLILKERLFLMERELGNLRMRLQCIERQNQGAGGINEEVIENESENECESLGDTNSVEENNEEVVEENNGGGGEVVAMKENNDVDGEVKEENKVNVESQENEAAEDVCMEDDEHAHDEVIVENKSKNEGAENDCS